LEEVKDELKITKVILAEREKSLIRLTEKRSSAREPIDKIKEEKLHADIEVTKLSAAKSELEKKLAEATEKITVLEGQLNNIVIKFEKVEHKILTKEKDNQHREEVMLGKAKVLLEKEKEIQNFKTIIEQRNKEIEFLKKNLEVEKGKTSYQMKRVESIEAQIIMAENVLKIITKIKDSIGIKGFLSDKELESILIEIKE
jgi:chromosome segregation ATPase